MAAIEVGDRVVVRTPDRREFRGRLVGYRPLGDSGQVAHIRLDTGWETTFPLHLVHPESSNGQTQPS